METNLGPETKLKAEMVGGKVKLSAVYEGHQVDAEVSLSADSDQLVDALLALIPGNSAFEAEMGMLLKAALKTVNV